jgi:hypothetical protein
MTSNWSWELEVDNHQEHHIKKIIKNVRPGCDVMASLLPLVKHMQNCHINAKSMINGIIILYEK